MVDADTFKSVGDGQASDYVAGTRRAAGVEEDTQEELTNVSIEKTYHSQLADRRDRA